MIFHIIHYVEAFDLKVKYFPLCGAILVVLTLVAPCAQAHQEPTPKRMPLSKIEFSGLQQRTQDEAIAASGLQVGQPVDIPTLDAAAQRLLDSGLFKKLSYRYRITSGQAIVTFQVEEDKGAVLPVVFDNFVRFSDEELLNAVRQHVPSFNGTAPDAAIDGITKALQQLLQERKVPGRVEYMPSVNQSTGKSEHVFSIEGMNLPICTLHFSGATAIQESELMKNSQPLIASDYTRSFVHSFAQANLVPIYRERGYLRVKFNPPTAKLETDAGSKCKDGVTVSLPVEEGSVYSWDKGEWNGNAALSVQELEAALGMKTGELANGLKIDKGMGSVREAYGRKGYLAARVKPVPAFEGANQRVTYHIDINEGSQYRMGMLTISGLSESTANRLKGKWKLQPGDVYDASYLKEFIKKEIVLDASEIGFPPKKMGTEIKPDRQKLTVDVAINFK